MNLKSPPTIKYILYKINTHQFSSGILEESAFSEAGGKCW